MIRAAIDGVFAVVLAAATGMAIALGLAYLGLTDTAWWHLGPWLAGLGLLGSWQQDVSSTVGAGWTVTATGAPLLVTGVVALFIAVRAKRSTAVGAPLAAAGAGAASAMLVLMSRTTQTVSNAAGSVTTVEALTWWVPLGAAGLAAGVWLVQTIGLPWWRSGRGVALGVLVWLGVVLTIGVAGAAVYLTSSTAVGVALGVLYPLAGTLALFGALGVPVEASLTRLTPDPLTVTLWQQGPLYLAGGVVAALVLAAITGLVLRVAKHRSTWLGTLTVTPLLAAFIGWAMSTTVGVPAGLGAGSRVVIPPLLAAAAGLVLGIVARFVGGRPRIAVAAAQPASDPDLDALLRDVGVQ